MTVGGWVLRAVELRRDGTRADRGWYVYEPDIGEAVELLSRSWIVALDADIEIVSRVPPIVFTQLGIERGSIMAIDV